MAIGSEINGSFENRLIFIELASGLETTFGQLIGGHPAGMKGSLAVAKVGVQPPPIVDEPAFVLEPVVQLRSWGGRQRVEVGQIQLGTQSKFQANLKRVNCILVVTKNKSAVNHDAPIAQFLDCSRVIAVLEIPFLLHLDQIVFIERLETDNGGCTATFFHQGQQFMIVGNINTNLARPANVQGNQGLKQRLGLEYIDKNVVIDQKDVFAVQGFNFSYYLSHRPLAEVRTVKSIY